MNKWYMDHKGKASTVRIIAMIGCVTGCSVMVAAVVGWFMQLPDPVGILAIGGGVTGIGEALKVLQAKGE